MKLQEFTELLTKPLMIKMETTDIACARLAQRQKTYIWIDTRLLYASSTPRLNAPSLIYPKSDGRCGH